MRTRSLSAVFFAIGLAVLLALLLRSALTATAGGGCEAIYVIQRGDTLVKIADELDTTVAELLRLNPGTFRDPDLIFPGQTLCVPSTFIEEETMMVDVEAENASVSQVSIEITYQFAPSPEEEGWRVLTSRGGFVGKRLVYPLAPWEPTHYITDTDQMKQRITGWPEPALLLVRSLDATTYTLALIGQGPPISASLHISDTTLAHPDLFECRGADVGQALVAGGAKTSSVTLWLEAEDGLRFQFTVGRISYMGEPQDANDCYNRSGVIVGLALVNDPLGKTSAYQPVGLYQAIVLLSHKDNQLGPAGNIRATNCTRWEGKRGLFYRWLRAFTRCRR